jgi:hypothetical protein
MRTSMLTGRPARSRCALRIAQRVVAAHLAVLPVAQLGPHRHRMRRGVGAARREQAAGRPVEHAGTTPGMVARRWPCRAALGQRRQQGFGIGMLRVGEAAAADRPLLHHLAAYITATRRAISLTTPMLCGDQHQRHAALLLQVAQQVQDLGLDGHVQGRGRLVAISRRGLHEIAIAIITRWFMPPDIWCG